MNIQMSKLAPKSTSGASPTTQKHLKEYRDLWQWAIQNSERLGDHPDDIALRKWDRLIALEGLLLAHISTEHLISFRKKQPL